MDIFLEGRKKFMNKYLKQLQAYNEKVKNFNYCLNMIYWDMETEKEFPVKAVDRTGGVIEFLSKEITNLLVSEEHTIGDKLK